MAVHKLDDETYKHLYFDEKLWKGINVNEITELVSNLYPPIRFVTSKSENKDFTWLYGRVKIKGKGRVKVIYPYLEEHDKDFTLRNISFSVFPFLTLKAEETDKFLGWYNSVTEEILQEEPLLTISESNYPEVTGFVAKFSKFAV
jgi:hypothetical protein